MDLGIPAMIATGFKTQAEMEATAAQLKLFSKTPAGQQQKDALRAKKIKRKVKYKKLVDEQRLIIEALESSLEVAKDQAVKDSLTKRIRFENKYLEELQDLI